MDKDKRAAYIRKIVTELNTGKLTADEKAGLWERIERSADGQSRSVRWIGRWKFRYIAAAVATVVLVLTLRMFAERDDEGPLIARIALDNQYLLADTGAVRLTMADQPAITLNDDEVVDLAAGTSGIGAADVFSTLTVPYGKRTEVILPDGSKIWLNAGSQLTFPEQFAADRREVYLEGEGYFDVMHDAARPFTVYAADMQIRVLGTSFNVSSYSDDAAVSAVLLSGRIELQSSGHRKFEPRILEPGHRAVLLKDKQRLTIHQDNAADYVSWTRRQLVLKNTPLGELLVKLERVYNTDIIDETGLLMDETFSGGLDLTQPIAGLLRNIYDHQQYKIIQSERRIVIQKKN